MIFKKYPSIENSYRDKHIGIWLNHSPELRVEDFIIVEKIHGANFQILIDEDGVRFASRNMLLSDDSDFFGYKTVVEKYKDMIKTFESMIDDKTKSLRIFGELFGSNIQKGVDYGKEKRIRIFDIYINEELLSQSDTIKLLDSFNLIKYFVPILQVVKGLDKALEFDTRFNTRLFNNGKENISEGVVIKPYNNVYTIEGKSVFYLKKKNDEFMANKQASKKKVDPLSGQLMKVRDLFIGYLGDDRVQTIFSQNGVIEEPKDIGRYIKLIMTDAREDFLKDHMDEFLLLDNDEKNKVFGVVGGVVVPLLEKYL